MSYMTQTRLLNGMRNTPVILKAILKDVSADQARQARDGADGWSVVEVMGHLHDFETIFRERTRAMLAEASPRLQGYKQDDLVRERNHQAKDVHALYDEYLQMRRAFVQELAGLSEEQWMRVGIHPDAGEITVAELAMNTALHDVLHAEQMLRALGRSERLIT